MGIEEWRREHIFRSSGRVLILKRILIVQVSVLLYRTVSIMRYTSNNSASTCF